MALNEGFPPGVTHAPGDGPEDNAWDYYWESDRPLAVFQSIAGNENEEPCNTELFDLYLDSKCSRAPTFARLIENDFLYWEPVV